MSATMTKQLYVYGITTQTRLPDGLEGISGSRPQLLVHGDLAAIVSELPDHGIPGLGREDMTAHAEVLAAVHRRGPVLPMRFGYVSAGAGELAEGLIGPHHDLMCERLAYLTGKVEYRLRATYDEDALLRELVAADPQIRSLRAELADKPVAATYYERIRLGELIAEAIERRRDHDADRMLAALEPFTADMRVSEPPHPRVALQVSVLVEQAKLAQLDEVVDGLGAAHAGLVALKFTGPLPPYSFVELDA